MLNPYYKRLGERLRKAREAKGWTQEYLAEKSGITPGFLSYLENGKRSGSLKVLVKLAEVLSLDPELLLGGKNTSPKAYPPFPSISLEGLTTGEGRVVRQMAQSLRRKKR